LRIKVGLNLISRNAEKAAEFIANGEVVMPQISLPSTLIEKPLYCKYDGNLFCLIVLPVLGIFIFFLEVRKKGCLENCSEPCKYLLGEIFREKLLTQKEILAEIVKHGHHCYRMINNKVRNTMETRKELAEHYKYAHNF